MLETFIKRLLNALAISSELVNVILLPITTKENDFKSPFRDIRFLISFQVFFKSLACKIC